MTEINLAAQSQDTSDATEPANVKEASDLDLLELFGDPNQVIVHTRDIDANGQKTRFYIKQLSMRDCAEISSKSFRVGVFGQIERDIEAQRTDGPAWLLHCCLVKNEGTAESPRWVPLWSIDEIKGDNAKSDARVRRTHFGPGLLDNPNHAMHALIGDLMIACWEINPMLNPIFQGPAEDKVDLE